MAIKKQTITGNITANVVTQNQQKMSIKNSSKVYSAISDYIYKNKIGSIIRELVSNAVDASNKNSKAVEIFIPDEKDVINGLPFYVLRKLKLLNTKNLLKHCIMWMSCGSSLMNSAKL